MHRNCWHGTWEPACRLGRPTPTRGLQSPPAKPGAILMEVLVALSLLFISAAVVFSGLSASFSAVNRARLGAEAADLAVSRLSEIQLGLLEAKDDGPNPCTEKDRGEWTWQIATETIQQEALLQSRLKRVQIVIAHPPTGLVHRLSVLLPDVKDDLLESTSAGDMEP